MILPEGIKSIELKALLGGEISENGDYITPNPIEFKPEEWEYYYMRNNRIYLRTIDGGKISFECDIDNLPLKRGNKYNIDIKRK